MSNFRKRAAVPVASAAAVGLVAAACGGTSSGTTTSSACQAAYQTWASGPHGKSAFKQISTDVGIVSTDLQEVAGSNERPDLVTATFDAGNKLGEDSYRSLQNPPPSCMRGFAGPYRAALSDARRGAFDIMAAMTSLRTGNRSAATTSVNAFASDIGEAQVNIKAAQAAVAREIKSGG
jgi:hypothetical protein